MTTPPSNVSNPQPGRALDGESGAPKPDLSEVTKTANAIRGAIKKVIEGKDEQIDTVLTVLLAGGHLLVEDVPGVGKTMLAKALGKSIDGTVRRIQFTPDLLPSDVTGVSVYNQDSHEFEFKPGGVFANIVVGDEINRASPKTQSALLEAMEEHQVSVDGNTHKLAEPFMVVATQNPIEMEGTYPMPEAQRDRFMARIKMGYPTRASEIAMLNSHGGPSPLAALQPVTDAATVSRMIEQVATVYVSDAVKGYIVDVVAATRSNDNVRLGASPRAGLHLLRAARAHAALAGRNYVIPEDVTALQETVLAHRVLPTSKATLGGVGSADIVRQAATSAPVPR